MDELVLNIEHMSEFIRDAYFDKSGNHLTVEDIIEILDLEVEYLIENGFATIEEEY